ncbi:MAG: hypothetical protein RID09_16770 [Coleofasciculus sp. G1-WW12-02]|uniref:hypothetical protein n=1 Tax=Coleofasciculus sp. G1-WW12-02 TaxID=3068483 RepID=UPI0032FD3291
MDFKKIIKPLFTLKYYLSKEGIKYLLRDIKGQILYLRNNDYGIPEPLINYTPFRFWIYPSYWRYLLAKFLKKLGLWHPESHIKNIQRRYLTGRPDSLAGMGHQLSNWNAALIYSMKYDLKFVHQPLLTAGGYNWEEFFNFGDGEVVYDEIIKDQTVKIVKLPRVRWIKEDDYGQYVIGEIIKSAYPGSHILFQLQSDCTAPNVYDHTPSSEILRLKYWNSRAKNPVECNFKDDGLNIACHVRRGDIVTTNDENVNLRKRWLENSYFIKIVKTITTLLSDKKCYINVFSQGVKENFQDFDQLDNVVYHLDEDQFKTFHSMVVADILILSPSSFSYKAGIISRGIKIAKYPWWHEIPNNSEWLRSDEDGNFNPDPIIERYSN